MKQITIIALLAAVTVLFPAEYTFIPAGTSSGSRPLPELPRGPEPFTVLPPAAAAEKDIVRVAEHAELRGKLREDAEDNLQGLLEIFAYMKKNHAGAPSRIILPAGVFRVKIGAKNELAFTGMSDCTLDGGGATLLFSYRTPEDANVNPLHLFRISTCSSVRIHDLILDWNWDAYPIASVLEVTRVDSESSRISFRITDPTEVRKRQIDSCPSIFSDLQPFDHHRGAIGVNWVNSLGITSDAVMTRRWGSTVNKFFEDAMQWIGDEVSMQPLKEKRDWVRAYVRPGFQYLMRHYVYNTGALWINGNTNLTLENITIYSAPGMGLRAGEGKGHHTLLSNVRIVNKPGTYGKRYCTAASDGMNFGSTMGYLIINNCLIENNLDDGINIHDKIHVSVAFTPGERDVTLNDFQWRTPFDIGDSIELQMPDRRPFTPPFIASVTGKKIVPKSGSINRYAVLTLDRAIPAVEADQKKLYVLNRSYESGNYIIRGTTIIGNKGRGILLQSANGLVEQCRVTGNRKHALDIESEMTAQWGEGYGPENIVVRNCVFENNNVETVWNLHRQSPVVRIGAVVGDYWKPEDDLSWGLLRSILFCGNTISAYPSAAMQITSSERVIICDNIFQNITRESTPGRDRNGGISVNFGRDIHVVSNRWAGEGVAHPGVFYDSALVQPDDIIMRGNSAVTNMLIREYDTAKISLSGVKPDTESVLRITFRTGDDGGIYRVEDTDGRIAPAVVDTFSTQNGVKEIAFPFRSPADTATEMKLRFVCVGKNAQSKNYYLKRYDGSPDNGAFRISITGR